MAWYDMWIGAYYDRDRKRLYLMCLGLGVCLWFERDYRHGKFDYPGPAGLPPMHGRCRCSVDGQDMGEHAIGSVDLGDAVPSVPPRRETPTHRCSHCGRVEYWDDSSEFRGHVLACPKCSGNMMPVEIPVVQPLHPSPTPPVGSCTCPHCGSPRGIPGPDGERCPKCGGFDAVVELPTNGRQNQ